MIDKYKNKGYLKNITLNKMENNDNYNYNNYQMDDIENFPLDNIEINDEYFLKLSFKILVEKIKKMEKEICELKEKIKNK